MSELACDDNEDEDGDTSRNPAAPSIIFAMEQASCAYERFPLQI
jgi:hypothetical protein